MRRRSTPAAAGSGLRGVTVTSSDQSFGGTAAGGAGTPVHRGVRGRPVRRHRLHGQRPGHGADRPGRPARVDPRRGQRRHHRAHLVPAQQHRAQGRPHRRRPAGGGHRVRVGRRRPGAARRPGHHADRDHGGQQRRQRGAGHRPAHGPADHRDLGDRQQAVRRRAARAEQGQGATASPRPATRSAGCGSAGRPRSAVQRLQQHRRRRSASTPTWAAASSRWTG